MIVIIMVEDFFKPKIMYAEIVQEPKFYLDKKNFLSESTSFILTGENLEYLVKVFNSKITAYLFKTFYDSIHKTVSFTTKHHLKNDVN